MSAAKTITTRSLLDFFGIDDNEGGHEEGEEEGADASLITWAHAVNTKQKLNDALASIIIIDVCNLIKHLLLLTCVTNMFFLLLPISNQAMHTS